MKKLFIYASCLAFYTINAEATKIYNNTKFDAEVKFFFEGPEGEFKPSFYVESKEIKYFNQHEYEGSLKIVKVNIKNKSHSKAKCMPPQGWRHSLDSVTITDNSDSTDPNHFSCSID